MDAYGRLFQTALFPLYETVLRKRPTLAYLKELERTQWFSYDQLHQLQSDNLRALMRHVHAHVPHYRRMLDDAGVGPDGIRTPEDLAKLPLLDRETAKSSSEDRKATGGVKLDVLKSTSGTSGSPLAFGYDRDSEYWRQAVRLRGYGWAGYRLGCRTFHFWGSLSNQYKPKLKQRLKLELDHVIRRDRYFDCSIAGEENLQRAVEEIRRFKPDVIVCYARAGAILARYIVENRLRDWGPISAICGAERVFPQERAYFEAAFGSVFETYGSREVMLMASECEAHDGMHTSMENLVVEVVVREEDGRTRAARPGEIGEVAVTDLHNYGMPFIRYLNGDLATAGESSRCSCGRSLTKLQSVEGRTVEVLRDGAGRPVSGMFFSVMFSVLGDKVRNFQVVQRRDGSIDVKVVPTSKFDSDLLATMRNNIIKTFPGVEVRTDLVPDIPAQANGKRRPVMVEQ
jgi:phenylacetate-CoA ligase